MADTICKEDSFPHPFSIRDAFTIGYAASSGSVSSSAITGSSSSGSGSGVAFCLVAGIAARFGNVTQNDASARNESRASVRKVNNQHSVARLGISFFFEQAGAVDAMDDG